MINENVRTEIIRQLDDKFPLLRGRSQAGGPKVREQARPPDLHTAWQKRFVELKDQLLDETLLLLHTLFDFSQNEAAISKPICDAFREIDSLDQCCSEGRDFDARTYASFLIRQSWHQGVSAPPGSLLTGLTHLQAAGFFQKVPRDITAWAKRFLYIERYHRLDALENEQRLDRYHILEASFHPGGQSVQWSFEDVVIWLERQLLVSQQGNGKDLGRLSRELTRELEGVLPGDFFGSDPFQPVVYAILKCHEFCLAETIDAVEQEHINRILAKRQMDSILDLMRLLIFKTTHTQQIPETNAILDQLQAEGFAIEHRGFRDPYEAQMVPIEDTERLESTPLPLFLPVENLEGQYEADLQVCRELLTDRHGELIRELVAECDAYANAVTQPLPRAQTVSRIIRFLVTWSLAQFGWLPTELPDELPDAVVQRLPASAVRSLVRQRKGYEIKSRSELNSLVQIEIRRQWEVLQGVAKTGRIFGFHDYAQFARFALCRNLVGNYGADPIPHLTDIRQFILEEFTPEWVYVAGKKRDIDTRLVEHHSLESVEEYVQRLIPSDHTANSLSAHFEISPNESRIIAKDAVQEIIPVFYSLLVAYERHRRQLSRLPAKLSQLIPMVNLLAPPVPVLHKKIFHELAKDSTKTAISTFRVKEIPYVMDAEEWKAYLAFHIHTRLGRNEEQAKDERELDRLLHDLYQVAQGVEAAPGVLYTETVLSTLAALLQLPAKVPSVGDDIVVRVVSLLPQLNCAACGKMSCMEFARSLFLDPTLLNQCRHLTADKMRIVSETIERLSSEVVQSDAKSDDDFLAVLTSRELWRKSRSRLIFRNVFSSKVQRTRRLFFDSLKKIWEDLPTKPQIFKCPDLDSFHQALEQHLGYEAVERIRDDERGFLIEHGEQRQKAEWQKIKRNLDWLGAARRSRQSKPTLETEDPQWVAGEFYRSVFFLHQLSREDRAMVIRRRLEEYQDGFIHWWNEDLLTMNLPDFRIRDWEDFSKIIKNAYWHQESSLPAMAIIEDLKQEFPRLVRSSEAACFFLVSWFRKEQSERLCKMRQLNAFRTAVAGGGTETIKDVQTLREVIDALTEELRRKNFLESGPHDKLSGRLSFEDRLKLERSRVWESFQKAGFEFAPSFSCRWDELTSAEASAFRAALVFSPPDPKSRGQEAVFAISGWQEPLSRRQSFIHALITVSVTKALQQDAEFEWAHQALERSAREARSLSGADPSTHQIPAAQLPASSIRLYLGRRIKEGAEENEVETTCRAFLDTFPFLGAKVVEDALSGLVRDRQYRYLEQSAGLYSVLTTSDEWEVFAKVYPEPASRIDLLLREHKVLDRDRLFRYLFLLAKMEGNLDALTALLREIRETSDIIDAAWLRFTQDRLGEGQLARPIPGVSLGIPLLASTLKHPEELNDALQNGISRKAPKNVTASYYEIIQLIRYHVIQQAEKNGNTDRVIDELLKCGYDWSPVKEEALRVAVRKEWDRRERFQDQKIWIFTSVVARRLAAQSQSLMEAEREFQKCRSDLLKAERGGYERYGDIVSRRGAALAQIKDEMYRVLSDLLENERLASFHKRIRQIVEQLDTKRLEIYQCWSKGEINRRTVFYALRQYQKQSRDPSWSDFQRFLVEHWFKPLEQLRQSPRPDRAARIAELDRRMNSLLGISLLELEAQCEAAAVREIEEWRKRQLDELSTTIERQWLFM